MSSVKVLYWPVQQKLAQVGKEQWWWQLAVKWGWPSPQGHYPIQKPIDISIITFVTFFHKTEFITMMNTVYKTVYYNEQNFL